MKRFLEMRGADGGPWRGLCAMPALWVGLLYDQVALDAAWDLVKDWSEADHRALRAEVPYKALRTEFRGRPLRELAGQVLQIAEEGLKRRRRLGSSGEDEREFLKLLETRVESGNCPADYILEDFKGPWQGDIDRAFVDCAY